MGKHYVPQFFLQGFARNGRLLVFDKTKAKWFPSQPKSVANEGDLWPDEIESFVTENIEDPAKHAIEKLRNRLQLSQQDRAAMAHYIAFLWKRVPANREQFNGNIPEISERIRAELNLTLKTANQKAVANAYIDKLIAQRPPELWQASIRTGFTLDIPGAITKMQWQVLHTDDQLYLASDNPLFFFRSDGMGQPTSEITLPLGSRSALVGHNRLGGGLFHVDATPCHVKEINRRTVSKATRFIFAEEQLPWMTPFVGKEHKPVKGAFSANRSSTSMEAGRFGSGRDR